MLLLRSFFYGFLVMMVLAVSCKQKEKPKPIVIVPVPEELQEVVIRQINDLIDYAMDNEGLIEDSLQLKFISQVSSFYEWSGNNRIWGYDRHWFARTDSMMQMLDSAMFYGMYAEDYHYSYLKNIMNKLRDSAMQKDAALWARGDLLLSNAFIHLAHDMHVGRLDADSTTLKSNWVLNDSFYHALYNGLIKDISPRMLLEPLEPDFQEYDSLKNTLKYFLNGRGRDSLTYVGFPYRDTMLFYRQLQERLMQDSLWDAVEDCPDSIRLSKAIRLYQKRKGFTVDGKITSSLIHSMNNFHKVQLARIALNLDRFKHLPDSMPASFILVNIPSYYLEVVDSGKLVLKSKIIVGKPNTRTPLLHSEVINFITYPQWTVPYSIVFKEMLPKIQKDITWLDEQNLMIVNYKDEVIDPHSLNWSKVTKKNFPYMIRQRQGDDNSLGVIKFNFKNKYDVYMHDTDARSLFDSPERAFSHGCMRIQQWDSLAKFLLWKQSKPRRGLDSLRAWMSRKEKHMYSLGVRIPIYVRYFTVKKGIDQDVIFYDDVYGEDNEILMGVFHKYLQF